MFIFATFQFQTAGKMVLNTVNWKMSQRVFSGTFVHSLIKTASLVVSTAVPIIKSRNESQTRSILRDPKKEFASFEIVTRKVKKGKGKGKAVPSQAWSGSEGSRKLRFPDFMTTVQDGGKVVSLTHRPPLPAGNAPGTHFC